MVNTEQRVPSRPSRQIFRRDLLLKPLCISGESAWRPQLAVGVVQWLSAHGYAVLATEVWRPEVGDSWSAIFPDRKPPR